MEQDGEAIPVQETQPTTSMEREDKVGVTLHKEEDDKRTTVLTLFRYSTKLDISLMALGTVAAIATGCIYPTVFILIGRTISVFIELATANNGTIMNGTNPFDAILDQNLEIIIVSFGFGAVIFVTGLVSFACWGCVADRQIRQIRIKFFQSVMRQDIAWFETHKSGELNTRFSEDTQRIYECMGIKLSTFLQFLFTWLSCLIAALILGWKLALVSFSFGPVLIVFSTLAVRYLRSVIMQETQKYAKAGCIANEAFTAIRTVHAFQGQEKECNRYNVNLEGTRKIGGKKGFVIGLNLGVMWAIIFMAYGVSFWYTVHLTKTDNLDGGILLSVTVLMVRGSGALGFALPYIETMSASLGSARKVFEIIDTLSVIDSSSDQGHKPQNVLGNIEFRNVCFSYPSRQNVQILQCMNLTVPHGKVLAVVGTSGSGKSTIVQLLQRFYDPQEGQIFLDGHHIKDLNIGWLRRQFGVVSQEPVLFDTTIAENIRYGNMDMDQDGIEKAARQANAHDFISHLPQGYDTVVGDRGAQLSGGQKQRIAIARALVRNPKILLLDEATSALDHESEAIVQSALEQAAKGRTTLIIAHRLSTVRNADSIVTISQGEVVEQGTHEELLRQKGLYLKLVKLQTNSEEKDNGDVEKIGLELEEETEHMPNNYTNTCPLDGSSFHEEGIRALDANINTTERKQEPYKSKDESSVPQVHLRRLLSLNSPEWPYLLFGCIGAMVCGGMLPGFTFIFADITRAFALKNNPAEQTRLTVILSSSMCALGVVFAFAKTLQSYCFAKFGAALTTRVRSMTFRAIVNQDMEFFDEPENQVGFLTTRLASDAQLIQLTSPQIGIIIEALSTAVGVLIICFVSGWKLSLVLMWFMPFLVSTGLIEGKLSMGSSDSGKAKLCGKIFTDSTNNIRTVASLCREGTFLSKYKDVLNEMLRDGVKRFMFQGFAHGTGQGFLFWTFGTALAYGSYLVQNEEMVFYDGYRIFVSIIFGGLQIGRMNALSGDYRRGKEAADRLFQLIDRPTAIQVDSTQGHMLKNYSGTLTVRDVWYHYKSRPNVTVMKGVSLDVRSGETVALVGTSGSGKSTMVQLIERFYDVERGAVLADDTPISSLDLKWWRSQLAIVSQEPMLFDCSISENIAYGDNSRSVPMDEIIAAARLANIHTFVDALPSGYDTNVGSQGTQLSGGQKQRIAIARALIRNPKVLLLDEATSSLDSDSERIIQETLENAREGRTCLVIAHRLSTVQNCDKIAVLKQGEIIEIGSHSELLEMKGAYFSQIQSQNRERNET